VNDLEQRMAALEVAVGRLAAIAAQASEPQSSIELSQNAKGNTQVTVKVYHREPIIALARAKEIYDALLADYAPKAVAS
jgi:NAD-specific glutamate dehydrogenase